MSTEQNNAGRDKSKSKEKIKKTSSRNNLKRPMTPYFLFCSKKREEHAKSGDGKKLTAKELGAMWKKLSEEEKKPFNEKYERELKKYNEMLNELNKKSEEEKDSEQEEDKQLSNKKKFKVKAKTKRSQNDKNNKKACNCGQCDECLIRKKRKEEEDEEIEDNKLAKKRAKKAVDDEGDD